MKSKDPTDMKDEVPSWVPPDLPRERLWTYALLWNFEIWLRTMVYVELRACYGDGWPARLKKGKAERAQTQDARLSHMPTREQLPTSYMQLRDLLNTVTEEWALFKPYFPPKNIWEAKMEELQQIRHRVAHFRVGHEDDQRRVKQVLRDIDEGFWRFCTSYNTDRSVLPASNDPVTREFLHLDPFPWNKGSDGVWARTGIADPNLRTAVMIEVSRREWAQDVPPNEEISGKPGFLYDIRLAARGQQVFDYSEFLASTERAHPSICHICLEGGNGQVRTTIPSVLGTNSIIDMITKLVKASEYALRPKRETTTFEVEQQRVEALVTQQPEYVLGPSNPLTFLGPDMPCSFFNVV